MDGYLRQSTASQSRLIGPFVDDTDFKTAETGLTIANTDIKLRANGTTLSNKNSGGGTHQANGMYSVTWDATDTANVGELKYSVSVAGALQVFGSYFVLEEAVYDALFAASGPGYVANAPVNVAQWNGSNVALPAVAGYPLTEPKKYGGADISTTNPVPASLDAAGLATDAVQEIRNAITGGAYALDTDANGRVRVVDGTGAGEIDTSSGSVSVFDFTTAAKALLQTEAEDALVVHRLDELLNADSDIDGAAPPTVGSVFHELMSKTAGSFTFDQTTDALEALRDRGDAAWLTATGFSTHSAADVWAVGTRSLTILDEDSTTLDLDATIRAAVGLASANLDTQLDALPTANEVRNAVTGGAYALDTDANGRIRIVDGTGTGELDTSSGKVSPVAADVRSAIGMASANLDSQIDALPTAAENFAAVLTTQLTESYAANEAVPTLAQAILAVHQHLMDFEISGTNYNVKQFGSETNAFVATLDDANDPTSLRRAA